MLPTHRKRGAIGLWLLMVLGMAFEMLGAGLVIPVIALLTQDDIATRYPQIRHVLDALGNPNQRTLIILSMLILVIVYFLKNSYLVFLAWMQSSFAFNVQSELSRNLFAIYLKQPYTFHLRRNSAHLIRNMQVEMSLFINSAVNPCILILAESLVVVGLFGLLVSIEPLGTLSVFGVLFFAAILFQRFTKHHIVHWSSQRQIHEGLRIKHLNQGLGGAKDVKLLGREASFLSQYAMHTIQSMKMNQRQFCMQQMPRLWLELLAIVGLALLMILMVSQNKPTNDMLPTIALFAAICFRLMPSANRLINSFQQIRFGAPAVNLLYRELNLPPDETLYAKDTGFPIFNNQLEINDVSYAYPGTEKLALDSISICIRKGQSVGFIGESGAGKSTLVDLILGLLSPKDGKITVDGTNILDNLRAWQDQIGYVPQSIYLTDDTLRKNVAFGLAESEIDDEAVKRAVKAAQLEKFINTLAEGINTTVGERGVRLSGGQRQRIGIARALYHDPSILILDEATSALDMETEAEVMASINALQGEKTILIVAHRLSTVKQCDQLFKLNSDKSIVSIKQVAD